MEDRKSAGDDDEDLNNTINPDAAHPMIDQDLYNDIEQFAQNQWVKKVSQRINHSIYHELFNDTSIRIMHLFQIIV